MKLLKSLILLVLIIGQIFADNAFIVNWNSDSVKKTLDAQVGDTISFYTSDSKSHSVVSSDGSISSSTFSGTASNPGKYIVTLKKEGTVEFTSPNDSGLSLIATVIAKSETVITSGSSTTGSGTPGTPTSTTGSGSTTGGAGSSTTGGTGSTAGAGLEDGSSSSSSSTGSSGSPTSSSNDSSSISHSSSDSSSLDNGDSSGNDNIVETPTPTQTPTATPSTSTVPTETPSATVKPTQTPSTTPDIGEGSSGISCLVSYEQTQFDQWEYAGIVYKVYQVNFTNEGILPVSDLTLTPSNVSNIFFVWEFKYDGKTISLPTYRDIGNIEPGSSINFGYISQNGDVLFTVKSECEGTTQSPTPTETTTPTPTETTTPTPTPTETTTPTPTPTQTETPTPTQTETPTPTQTSNPTPTPTSGNGCNAQVNQQIVNSWINGEVDHYIQVQVTIKNMGTAPISKFNFYSEAEQIWSVDKVDTNKYSLPSWASTIPVGGSHSFGYVTKAAELSTLEQVEYSCE